VTLHLQYAAHLGQRHLLSVAQADDLVKCTEQIESVFEDFAFLCIPAHVRHDAGDQMQRLNVLKDIRGLVRDQEDVKFLQRLIYVSNFGGFDRRVLGVCRDEFWEGGQEGFNPGSRHVSELARNHDCRCVDQHWNRPWSIRFRGYGVTFSAFRAYRGGENNLGVYPGYYCGDAEGVACTPLLVLDVRQHQSCLKPVSKVR